jgi:YcaO-like protein with predicted kinase domain
LPDEIKRYRAGTDRTVDPAVTVARARRVARACGISRLANITHLDRVGIPVFSAVRPLSRSVSVAQGKGATPDAARASALMEAIEAHHAENVTAPLVFASIADARRSRPIVDVSRLARFDCDELPLSRRILWVQGAQLAGDAPVWLPLDVVHTDYTGALVPGPPLFFCSSNGLASGNTRAEAIAHGLCELIERDALTLASCRSGRVQGDRRVDLATVDDPLCQQLLAQFAAAGVEVLVEDVTSDVAIACLRCTVWDAEREILRPMLPISGFGCHPRREVALVRALTEAAQGRAILISGARDDLSLWHYDEARAVRLAAACRAVARRIGPGRAFDAIPSHDDETMDGDVAWILARLAAADLPEVAVVDLSKPDIGIPVVRVVVPGLEAMSEVPGYRPGARAIRAGTTP